VATTKHHDTDQQDQDNNNPWSSEAKPCSPHLPALPKQRQWKDTYANSLRGRLAKVQDQAFREASEDPGCGRKRSRLEGYCSGGRRTSRTIPFASGQDGAKQPVFTAASTHIHSGRWMTWLATGVCLRPPSRFSASALNSASLYGTAPADGRAANKLARNNRERPSGSEPQPSVPPWDYLHPPSVATSATSEPGAARVYHGNVGTHVFHAPNCPQYNCKNCTKELPSREAAIAAGFRPCGICRP